MPTSNEILVESEIGHALDRQHYSNGVVRRLLALLNRVDADLFATLTAALERLPSDSFTVERLEQLLFSVRALNLQAYQELGRELSDELRGFVQYEAGYQHQLFEAAIPRQITAQIAVATVDVGQVYQAAMGRPFQGRLLSEWASSIEADRMVRIRDALRIGYVEGQTIGQMVQRIRGTRAKGYSDGIIEIDRRNAESVVRTAISHTAANTREAFYGKNGDLIKALQWHSTLDARTTTECQVRDGLKYTNAERPKPIGHLVPWCGKKGCGPGKLHWGCRSTSVPVLKSWRELGGVDIEEFSPSTRASMDGQTAADTTYQQWLAKQSAARQDEVLGPTRGRLLRQGGLTVDRFSNDKGRWLSLEELKVRDSEAFRKAGIAAKFDDRRAAFAKAGV